MFDMSSGDPDTGAYGLGSSSRQALQDDAERHRIGGSVNVDAGMRQSNRDQDHRGGEAGWWGHVAELDGQQGGRL